MEPRLSRVFMRQVDEVVRNNSAAFSFTIAKPYVATVAPETVPGLRLDATPDLRPCIRLHRTSRGNLMVCYWFLRRRRKCEQIVDCRWDLFCNLPSGIVPGPSGTSVCGFGRPPRAFGR